MILPKKEDAIHKAWLYRLLTAVADNNLTAKTLAFKGGSCAAMRGWLDRFSVDLDFDFIGSENEIIETKKELEKIIKRLGLEIKDKSTKWIQYFLKYEARDNKRNTLKLDILKPPPRNNKYEKVKLLEIDRVVLCQTKETMVANKLVAVIDRFERTNSIAGRDIYDVYWFLMNGFDYEAEVIKERQKKSVENFFVKLIDFIDKEVKQKYIDQDLNFLLPNNEFQKIRKILKSEVLRLLKDEVKRIKIY